jgi:CO/xanthine dehydrogenase FAD-binding subunit
MALRSTDRGGPSSAAAGRAADRAAKATAESVRHQTDRMIRGFGSVGGEEMLSYMMTSDTLADERAEEWTCWQQRIGAHLVGIQNGDGSWSGNHCIASTPFVSDAAVMTLGAGPAT